MNCAWAGLGFLALSTLAEAGSCKTPLMIVSEPELRHTTHAQPTRMIKSTQGRGSGRLIGRKSYILVDYSSHRAVDGKNSFSHLSHLSMRRDSPPTACYSH